MLEDACPICLNARQFRIAAALERLERRRFPNGRLVCPHESHRWHLHVERLRRELDLTRDARVQAALRAEIEDILVQHVTKPQQVPEPPSSVKPNEHALLPGKGNP